jgi:uncharacterized repeat protein (TIGR01451 family)
MKRIYLLLLLSLFVKAGFAQCAFTINTQIVQDITCNGGNNGKIAASATGGIGPYTYDWKANGFSFSSNDTIDTLIALTYLVLVTDQGAACTDSVSVNLIEPMGVGVVDNGIVDAYCGGASGNICVFGVGGTPGYTYSFMGGPFSANPCFGGLPAGTYTVTAMDAQGCFGNNMFFVNNIPGPSLTVLTTPTNCGMCDGTASLSINGGSAPYTYLWSPTNQTTATVSGLCAGTSTVQVMDANGCAVAEGVQVYASSNITSLVTTITPSACGQSNGSITIDAVNGGIPPFQYGFFPSPFPLQSSNSLTNLSAGIDTVVVVDSLGCSFYDVVVINNSNFAVQLIPTMPTCNLCDGSINSNIIGGSAPYNYNWSDNSQSGNVSNVCSGNYFLEVTDSAGCYAAAAISLSPLNAPVIQVDTVVNASCLGSGSASISVTGGVGAITYLWTPGGNTTPNPNLIAGSYTVTATDANGCSTSSAIYIGNNANVYVYTTQVGQPNCAVNGFIEVGAFGGTAPYNFNWNNGAIGDSIGGLNGGNYFVTVTDANGCAGNGQFILQSSCYNILSGTVYNDANQNCIQDVGELGLASISLHTNVGYYGYTDANGHYTIYTPEVNPIVSFSNYNLPYYTPTCPVTGSQQVNFTTTGDTVNNVNFGYYADPNYFDLSIHPGWTAGHPGFAKDYWIYFQNQSTALQNAVVRFVYDSVLIFNSANAGGVHNPTLHTIEWTYSNLPANKDWDWQNDPRASFTVPVSVPITASLHSYFEIIPISGDAYPTDNVLDIIEPVTGSRDPNDKSVIPKGEGPTGNILQTDSTLLYTVRFQNNGNDTAYTVVVVDTLSQYLDPSTIVPGASKHPYTFTLSGQGVMTWRFDHIMLPDSLRNEPESKGFFNYTVKQKQNNPLGTVIENTAYIYFDFNEAIITNTTINTLVAPVALNESKLDVSNFIIYPNPANSEVMIQFETKEMGDVKLELYNIMGEVVKTKSIRNTQKGNNLESLNLIDVASGIYFVKVKTATTQSVQKLVIAK